MDGLFITATEKTPAHLVPREVRTIKYDSAISRRQVSENGSEREFHHLFEDDVAFADGAHGTEQTLWRSDVIQIFVIILV